LAAIWLVAKILVANKKLRTYHTFSSQFLPKFWPTQSLANFLASQLLAKIDRTLKWHEPDKPQVFVQLVAVTGGRL
jgi:hypothetical protein